MSARRAFTVLELVVVIGVILILMALALSVTSAVLAANDRRSMETTFKLLEQAMDSWQSQMGRSMTFGRRAVPGVPAATPDYTGTTPTVAYDIYEINATSAYIICVMVEQLAVAGSESSEILAKVPASALRFVPVNGGTVIGDPLPANWLPNRMPTTAAQVREIIDPWGRRISSVFPGRPATKAELANPAIPTDANDGTVRTQDETSLGICRNRRPYFISCGPDGDFTSMDDNIFSYEPLPRP
ncbi:MAG: type II secretion system protein [Phycisphaerales bacterium]|nr:type II secretion system protein [Phycisphaerales bacterium]